MEYTAKKDKATAYSMRVSQDSISKHKQSCTAAA